MTDKEIIKALECCLSGKEELCKECPLNGKCYGDIDYLLELVLDLINRQQQDISTLKTKCYCISNNRDRIKKRLEIVSRDLQEGSSRLTEAEREKFWKTSDDEIREFWLQLYNYTVPENVKQVIPANMLLKLGHITKSTIDFINRQQEQLEATIAGQETLQKALAEKDREVAELNSDLKLLKNDYDCLKTNFDETVEKNKRLRDKVVGLTAEKDRLIETFGECQEEATRALVEKDKGLFLLNNIAGFKVISEDGSKKEATTTDKTKSCLWCHDMRGNKNLGFTVSDKLAREIINNRFINFCPFCGRELRG